MSDIKEKIIEARSIAKQKKEIYDKVLTEYRDKKQELLKMYEKIVEQKLSELFGNEVNVAKSEYNEADGKWKKLVNEEMETESLNKLKFPEGTYMIEWEYSPYGGDYKETGRRGTMEVFRDGDAFPSNARSWNTPVSGDVVVRLFKKDGSKGNKIERLGYCRNKWLPEGIEPTKE